MSACHAGDPVRLPVLDIFFYKSSLLSTETWREATKCARFGIVLVTRDLDKNAFQTTKTPINNTRIRYCII